MTDQDIDIEEEQSLSPVLAKRFLRAFIRAAQKQQQPQGKHLREATRHLYTFQRDVLRAPRLPHLLREEINELQRKINLALNQEKYIATIKEQENSVIRGMELPFRLPQHVPASSGAASKRSDFPTSYVPVEFPFPQRVVEHLPAVREPSFHARMLEQVEQQLLVIQDHAIRLRKQKSVDKKQLLRIEKLIRQHQRKIRQLKKKYAG